MNRWGGPAYDLVRRKCSQYDFYNFNAVNGTVAITAYVSPSMNANGRDRPLGFAIQVDNETPQTVYYIPSNVPGQLPTGWDAMVSI